MAVTWTTGNLMLYGGYALTAVGIIGLILTAVLSDVRKKRVLEELSERY